MNKTFLNATLLFFVIFTFSKNIYATTYYLSPAGNDSSAGTSPSTAWLTISKVNSTILQPGDSILFEGGQTFNGNIDLFANDANDSNNVVTFSSYGTGNAIINSGDTIGFYAYNTQGFTISNLIFEGSGMNTNNTDGIYLYVDLNGNVKFTNVVISNVEILNYGGIGLEVGASPEDNGTTGFRNLVIDSVHVHHVLSSGIEVWGAWGDSLAIWSHQNVEIMNTLIDSVPGFSAGSWEGSGIVIAEVDGGLMDHCVAHDNGTGNTNCGGPVGIWAYDANNITIQFCESYHNSGGAGCDGGGFDFDGGETNSIMQYNYSHDNDGNAFLLGQFDYAHPWFNNVVRYNISENDGRTNGGGINLFKGDGTTMTGAIIYQNTIYISPNSINSGPGAFNITEWDTGIDSIQVYNNIFQTTGSPDSVELIDVPTGYSANFAGNLYWASGDTLSIYYQDSTYTNLAAWRAATGVEMIGSSPTGIVADPLLTNAGNGGTAYPNPLNQLNAYMLPSNSPAVSSGLNLMTLFDINAGDQDFFDNPLPVGVPDIGAYQSPLTTSVKAENKKFNISSYPNPVIDKIYVNLPQAGNNEYTIHVIDMKGCEVMAPIIANYNKTNLLVIDVRQLASGIYALQVISEQGINWAKVVKE